MELLINTLDTAYNSYLSTLLLIVWNVCHQKILIVSAVNYFHAVKILDLDNRLYLQAYCAGNPVFAEVFHCHI